MEWNDDMEAAPEGDLCLFFGKWNDGREWQNIGQRFGEYAVGPWDDGLEPTHWMPLPPPPEKA